MSSIIETEKRFLFPTWKSFEETLKSGELIGLHTAKEADYIFNSKKTDLYFLIEQWKKKKNIYSAAEILGHASMMNISSDLQIIEVAKYILAEQVESGELLTKLAKEIINGNEEDQEFDLNVAKLKSNVITDIRKFKQLLKNEPHFAVGHIELGRLYTFLGQENIAESHINKALLMKSDRYILRSAARFYIHLGEFDSAFEILAKSENASKDPWILSGIMGLGEKIGKTKNYIAKSKKLIDNYRDSHFQFAELKSALGTTMFFEGDNKYSSQLFNESLESPTDNSLAQVFWYSKLTENKFNKYYSAAEANTLIQYRNNNFSDSFSSCKKWITEEPLSTRALNIASYTASVFLEKYDESIKIAKYGLELNPDNVGLKNNLAYDLILSGKLDEAEKILNNLTKVENDKLENVIKATKGLLDIQKGDIESGKEKYFDSIRFFEETNEEYSESLAFLNYLKVILTLDPSHVLSEQEQKLLKKSGQRNEIDIQHFYNNINKKIIDAE